MGYNEVPVAADKLCVASRRYSAREQAGSDHAPRTTYARRQQLAILEATPDFVVTFDVAGHILSLNPAARRLLGVAADDDGSSLHIADAHPTWAKVIVLGEGIETALLDGVWQGETALLTWQGQEIPVSEVILAHRDAGGECDYLSLVARDLSEWVAGENTLRRSEQFYRRLVETANTGIWLVDPENRVAFANPAMARRLGYTVEELVGQPLATVMDVNAAPAPGPHRRDFTLRRKDGSTFRTALATSPLYDGDEQYAGVLGIVTDKKEPHSN